ncbi:acyl-CoA ligase (AMP-forming), exosortase A system-associated [Acrocarpospora corrugata]|uniref:Acyl-CoA ligase (AMP-forming), exosortase A system-associated n=1 Tax=Acrocarpospora corrugata TaxID=35763 RepID=A0A5M3VR05_9ACTN|nr:AMP-binding protein [Acrocarpospora corrugata]GER99226.1 acyl-CoA ligase (AMP-forming), exosortase A system-associated [Acrocarpospora corrugata]
MLTRFEELLGFGAAEHAAVTYKNVTLTYGELRERVARAAEGLRWLEPGARVAIYAEKQLETVVAMFAVAAAGGVFVPINPLFKARQVEYVIEDCAAALLITTPERARTLSGSVRTVLIGDLDVVTTDPPSSVDHDISDIAGILYTSGSTGSPKGVVLSHGNLLAGAASVAGYLGHAHDDVVLAALPLSFDAGLSQLTTSFLAGAHVVLVNYLLPREVVRLCATHGVTALTCVPPLWAQLATQRWPAEATRGLRYFANTGGRLPKTTLAWLRETFPQATPFLMYGLTEAFRSTYLDPAEIDRRPGSIGKAVPNAEVLVVRADGSECDPGEEGEIVHRGALVSLGYWNDPARTAERFRPFPPGGDEIAVWSGDVAYRDEEGFIFFVGRTDDMIKTSGYRLSPTEVEEAAYATGLVAEAVAVGVPDEDLGEHVVLHVVLTEAAAPDGLRLALERDLPRYMVPRRIVTATALPRSGNGKFDRAEIRRSAAR